MVVNRSVIKLIPTNGFTRKWMNHNN
jgi:hypothetical protein